MSFAISASAALERVAWVSRQLLDDVAEFNKEHPDQDAWKVAQGFDYLTDGYVVQICASVLVGRHFLISPEEGGVSEMEIKAVAEATAASEPREALVGGGESAEADEDEDVSDAS